MNYYYSEESTEFYPSKMEKKYLIYNEYYTNKKMKGVQVQKIIKFEEYFN